MSSEVSVFLMSTVVIYCKTMSSEVSVFLMSTVVIYCKTMSSEVSVFLMSTIKETMATEHSLNSKVCPSLA